MTRQEEKTILTLESLEEQVPDSLHPVLQFIVDNRVLIVGGIALLIAAVGGTAVYNAAQASSIAQAQENLSSIAAIANINERITKLTTLEETIPDQLSTVLLLEMAHAFSASQDYEQAVAVWKKIAEREPVPLQTTARLGQAMALAQQGKQDEALVLLDTLEKEAPQDYQGIILYHIGRVAMAAQQYARAQEAYEELKVTAGPSPNEAFIDYQIQQAQKSTQQAQ